MPPEQKETSKQIIAERKERGVWTDILRSDNQNKGIALLEEMANAKYKEGLSLNVQDWIDGITDDDEEQEDALTDEERETLLKEMQYVITGFVKRGGSIKGLLSILSGKNISKGKKSEREEPDKLGHIDLDNFLGEDPENEAANTEEKPNMLWENVQKVSKEQENLLLWKPDLTEDKKKEVLDSIPKVALAFAIVKEISLRKRRVEEVVEIQKALRSYWPSAPSEKGKLPTFEEVQKVLGVILSTVSKEEQLQPRISENEQLSIAKKVQNALGVILSTVSKEEQLQSRISENEQLRRFEELQSALVAILSDVPKKQQLLIFEEVQQVLRRNLPSVLSENEQLRELHYHELLPAMSPLECKKLLCLLFEVPFDSNTNEDLTKRLTEEQSENKTSYNTKITEYRKYVEIQGKLNFTKPQLEAYEKDALSEDEKQLFKTRVELFDNAIEILRKIKTEENEEGIDREISRLSEESLRDREMYLSELATPSQKEIWNFAIAIITSRDSKMPTDYLSLLEGLLKKKPDTLTQDSTLSLEEIRDFVKEIPQIYEFIVESESELNKEEIKKNFIESLLEILERYWERLYDNNRTPSIEEILSFLEVVKETHYIIRNHSLDKSKKAERDRLSNLSLKALKQYSERLHDNDRIPSEEEMRSFLKVAKETNNPTNNHSLYHLDNEDIRKRVSNLLLETLERHFKRLHDNNRIPSEEEMRSFLKLAKEFDRLSSRDTKEKLSNLSLKALKQYYFERLHNNKEILSKEEIRSFLKLAKETDAPRKEYYPLYPFRSEDMKERISDLLLETLEQHSKRLHDNNRIPSEGKTRSFLEMIEKTREIIRKKRYYLSNHSKTKERQGRVSDLLLETLEPYSKRLHGNNRIPTEEEINSFLNMVGKTHYTITSYSLGYNNKERLSKAKEKKGRLSDLLLETSESYFKRLHGNNRIPSEEEINSFLNMVEKTHYIISWVPPNDSKTKERLSDLLLETSESYFKRLYDNNRTPSEKEIDSLLDMVGKTCRTISSLPPNDSKTKERTERLSDLLLETLEPHPKRLWGNNRILSEKEIDSLLDMVEKTCRTISSLPPNDSKTKERTERLCDVLLKFLKQEEKRSYRQGFPTKKRRAFFKRINGRARFIIENYLSSDNPDKKKIDKKILVLNRYMYFKWFVGQIRKFKARIIRSARKKPIVEVTPDHINELTTTSAVVVTAFYTTNGLPAAPRHGRPKGRCHSF